MPPAKPPMKNANPSGPSAAQRKMFAKMGIAMPDGSYYIRNAADLANAIPAVGRGEAAGDSGDAIRVHIMKRAKALGLSSKIPDTWNPDGSLKQPAAKQADEEGESVGNMPVDEFFEHFGVKGMKWGVRKSRPSGPASDDAARARTIKAQVKSGGIHSVSTADLQHLVTRMNVERQFATLAGSDVSKGETFVKGSLKTAKIGLDAYNTGMQIKKIIDGAKK